MIFILFQSFFSERVQYNLKKHMLPDQEQWIQYLTKLVYLLITVLKVRHFPLALIWFLIKNTMLTNLYKHIHKYMHTYIHTYIHIIFVLLTETLKLVSQQNGSGMSSAMLITCWISLNPRQEDVVSRWSSTEAGNRRRWPFYKMSESAVIFFFWGGGRGMEIVRGIYLNWQCWTCQPQWQIQELGKGESQNIFRQFVAFYSSNVS